ncbi:MAG: preprotein translocase subunit SecG [FCB group bacterium]|nr:preprotein translocase subunit SecG [FCB group bacterium]MBL7028520.1 preprotein translocase subunit SecG [Candidatus Neomarinimicrobiota bacterium]MBL7121584.1 preprotein translocase subunit SecG [Candidatus Neomarinimicrobiota bacterium]
MTFLYIILVIISLLLMMVILMQSSKGGGLAGTFGGGNTASALFGGVGAGNFLTKLTGGLAVAFMVIIILIGVLNKGGSSGQTDFQRELQEEMIVPGTQFEAAAPAELGLPGEAATAPATTGDATSDE